MPDSHSMLPQNPLFHVRPKRILAAVDALPEAKGKNRKPKIMLGKLRAKLLQISIADVSNWRLKPAVLATLPYLAAERNNEALLERVIALALGSMPDMPERILIRLLPFIIHSKRVRKAAFDRFSKQEPSTRAPVWLAKYWTQILKPGDPAKTMAKGLIKKQTPLALALKSIELDATTPFSEAIISQMWVEMEPEHLMIQPFEDSLIFISKSGQDLNVRRLFLTWMLNTYSIHIQTLADIDTGQPQRLLIKTALELNGSPGRSTWRNCKDNVLSWAWNVHHDLQLQDALNPAHNLGRAAFWRRYIQHIKDIRPLTESGLIIIDLGGLIAVENTANVTRCALFERTEFMSIWQKNKWKRRAFRLPTPMFQLVRSPSWQEEMAEAICQSSDINGENWS